MDLLDLRYCLKRIYRPRKVAAVSFSLRGPPKRRNFLLKVLARYTELLMRQMKRSAAHFPQKPPGILHFPSWFTVFWWGLVCMLQVVGMLWTHSCCLFLLILYFQNKITPSLELHRAVLPTSIGQVSADLGLGSCLRLSAILIVFLQN